MLTILFAAATTAASVPTRTGTIWIGQDGTVVVEAKDGKARFYEPTEVGEAAAELAEALAKLKREHAKP